MLERDFIQKMYEQNGCPVEVAQRWVSFAQEIVGEDQYVNFIPAPKEKAVQDWLSSIYAACYFVKRWCGDEAIQAIYKLTDIPHCLYPYEIIGVMEHLKKGGDLTRLAEKSLDGTLSYDGKLPTLTDVERDLNERRKRGRDAR